MLEQSSFRSTPHYRPSSSTPPADSATSIPLNLWKPRGLGFSARVSTARDGAGTLIGSRTTTHYSPSPLAHVDQGNRRSLVVSGHFKGSFPKSLFRNNNNCMNGKPRRDRVGARYVQAEDRVSQRVASEICTTPRLRNPARAMTKTYVCANGRYAAFRSPH